MTTRHSGSRRAFLGTGVVLAIGALGGCLGRGFGDDVVESTAESFPSDDVRSVEVRNAVGRVSVRGTATDAVKVRIDKRSQTGQRGLDAVTVGTTLTEGVLRVVADVDTDATTLRDGRTPSVDVAITVPEGSAGPAITGVDADVGEVSLSNTRGDTVVRTDVGRIVASDVDGYLSLTSSVGTIEAAGVTGLDHVYTELGEVKVDLLGLRGDVDVGAEMGSVAVGVADDLDLDLLAESGGRVSSTLTLSELRADRNAVSGRLNRGGSRVRVFSEMGEVDLRTVRRAT